MASAEVIKLRTKDKLVLAADWHPPKGKKYGVVLAVHGYSKNRQSFASLVTEAATYDLGLLCLDLRGFGASAKQGDRNLGEQVKKGDLALFSKMHQDIGAAMSFLKKKGFGPDKTVLLAMDVGASVGTRLRITLEGFSCRGFVDAR